MIRISDIDLQGIVEKRIDALLKIGWKITKVAEDAHGKSVTLSHGLTSHRLDIRTDTSYAVIAEWDVSPTTKLLQYRYWERYGYYYIKPRGEWSA